MTLNERYVHIHENNGNVTQLIIKLMLSICSCRFYVYQACFNDVDVKEKITYIHLLIDFKSIINRLSDKIVQLLVFVFK